MEVGLEFDEGYERRLNGMEWRFRGIWRQGLRVGIGFVQIFCNAGRRLGAGGLRLGAEGGAWAAAPYRQTTSKVCETLGNA